MYALFIYKTKKKSFERKKKHKILNILCTNLSLLYYSSIMWRIYYIIFVVVGAVLLRELFAYWIFNFLSFKRSVYTFQCCTFSIFSCFYFQLFLVIFLFVCECGFYCLACNFIHWEYCVFFSIHFKRFRRFLSKTVIYTSLCHKTPKTNSNNNKNLFLFIYVVILPQHSIVLLFASFLSLSLQSFAIYGAPNSL